VEEEGGGGSVTIFRPGSAKSVSGKESQSTLNQLAMDVGSPLDSAAPDSDSDSDLDLDDTLGSGSSHSRSHSLQQGSASQPGAGLVGDASACLSVHLSSLPVPARIGSEHGSNRLRFWFDFKLQFESDNALAERASQLDFLLYTKVRCRLRHFELL
jgi:hypothetical protein